MATEWTQGAGKQGSKWDSWELSEPRAGVWDCKEALRALCYFCGVQGSPADTVTHGGILPGIIDLALLTAHGQECSLQTRTWEMEGRDCRAPRANTFCAKPP